MATTARHDGSPVAAGPPATTARVPSQPSTADGPAATRLHPLAQIALLIGPLLTMLDSSIVNVAVADIVRELHAGLASVQWVVSGYLLALATGLAATSYLARRFGTLPVYTLSMIAFIATSAACALAGSPGWLVAARAVQGLAGAPLVPMAMTILLGGGPGGGMARRIPVAAGLLFFLAPALGPTLGGLLVNAGGWRWIFLVNLPVGLLGLLGLRRLPPGSAPPRQPGARFDPLGLTLLSGGLVGTLYGTSHGTVHGWTSPASALPLAAGMLLLAAYVAWALRRAQPAVDLALLRHRQSALSVFLSVVSSVVAFGAVFLLPVFAQTVQRHSALATGLAMLPQGIITGLGTALGQRLARHITVRTLTATGFAVLAATSAGLLLLTATTPLWVTAAILSGRAVAIGFVVTPLLFAMLRPLREDQLADGNTLFNITQRLGGSIGVSVLASLLATRSTRIGGTAAFHEIGVILSITALIAALIALLLAPVRQESTRAA